MRHLANLGVLFILCMFSLLFVQPDIWYVLAFLCALILCCLIAADISPLLLSVPGFLMCGAAFLCTDFLFFCPLSVYGLLHAGNRRYGSMPDHSSRFLSFLPPAAAAALYLLRAVFAPDMPSFFLFLCFFGLLLAFLLEGTASRTELLEESLKRIQDDSSERDLLLTEKNRSLLEKQDYEVYTATLKERNRIAREIHDNVGHLLSRSILLTGALKAVSRDAGISRTLDSLDESLNQAMDSIRSSVHDLRDEAVDLDEAVRSLIQNFSFCPVDYHYDCSRSVPREVKYSFISITKEALSNIMRHSNATKAVVTLREHPAIYQLCIEDNGTSVSNAGFKDGEPDAGMGLSNIRERTLRLGGYFHIFTDRGFKILVTIPKETTV